MKGDFQIFRIESTNKMQANKEDLTDMIASTDKFVNEVQTSSLTKIEIVR